MTDAAETSPTPTTPPSRDIGALLQQGQGRWVLDPVASRVEFHVKHFWHMITVHGRFDRVEGEGTVAPDGTVSGQLRIDAASLNTGNKQRDKHLRSADFFDVEHHPEVIVALTGAEPAGDGLACQATIEAAGHSEPVEFTAHIDAASAAATAAIEVIVDRSKFGMTWSPLRMSSMDAKAIVVVRFVHD